MTQPTVQNFGYALDTTYVMKLHTAFQKFSYSLLAFVLIANPAFGQALNSVSAPGSKLAACDEFFTDIDKPADMSSTRDINRFIPSADVFHWASAGISGGLFTGVSASNDARLYLLSPRDCGAHAAAGRWGADTPIDTTKYTRVAIRMWTDVASGMQISWNQDCSYHLKYLVTKDIPTKTGWNTYLIDMPSQSVTSVEGGTGTWTTAPATSFRIDPTSATGATVRIDWVRLENPATCATGAVSMSSSSTPGYTISLFSDDDSSAANGYGLRIAKDIPSGTNTTNISSSGLTSADTVLRGWLTDDYATGFGDPWDFANSDDVSLTGDITNLNFASESANGTSPGGAPSLYLRTYDNGIDTSRFRYVSLKVTQSSLSNLAIFWGNGSGFQGQLLTQGAHDPDLDGVYQVDLGQLTTWTNTPRFTEFVIRPVSSVGATFGLQWVQLSSAGFKTSQPVPISAQSTGPLAINNSPYASLLEPSEDGGAAFRVWNFRSTDEILEPANLSTAEILPYNLIDGRVGSFFHGRSNTNDPVFYLVHPFRPFPSILIDADRFTKLSWSEYVKDVPDRIDILNGSVIRVIYRDPVLQTLQDGDDIIHTVDGWGTSGWMDFAIDLKSYRLETGATTTKAGTWSGNQDGLRIDPHEFTDPYDFYFGRTALRAADEAGNTFAIVFDATELDGSDNPSIKFYANTSNTTSGGVLLATTTYNTQSRVVLADTSGLTDGTYYLYVEISDSKNTVRRLAKGELKINRSLPADTTAPTLNVRTPSEGMEFDAFMPIEGYAFDDKFAALQVTLDGQRLVTFKPNGFDIAAATNESSQEAPYSGFERSLDTSSVAVGPHTLVITAFDTSGNTTVRTFNVNKRPGAAPTFSTKPDPSSPAVAVPGGSSTPLPTATATPVAPTGPAITLKAAHAKNGLLTLTVGKVPGKTACTLAISGGETATGSFRAARSVKAAKTKKANRSVIVTASVPVAKKKLAGMFFSVRADCGGTISASPVAQAKFKSSAGLATFDAVMSKLSKKLVVKKSAPRSRRR